MARRCTAGTTHATCRSRAKTSQPSWRFGTGYSARRTCRSTSRVVMGWRTRLIRSADLRLISYNTRIHCAERKKRAMGDLIGTAVDGTLYWIGPSELRRLRELDAPAATRAQL